MRPVLPFLCLCAVLPAQGPGVLERLRGERLGRQFAAVAERLGSDEPRDIAWGGWLASELDLREAEPELRDALGRLAELPADDQERRFAAKAVLDALIRIDSTPNGAELAPFLRFYTFGAAFVLLARQPRAHREQLMALLEEHATEEGWQELFIACGNLLTATGAPGFAKRGLDVLHVELTLSVSDSDVPIEKSQFFAHSYRSFRSSVEVPAGFPPVVDHELRDRPDDGAPVIAPGPVDVGDLRRVHRSRRYNIGGGMVSFDPEDYFRGWLIRLAGGARLGFRPQESEWVDLREADFLIAATRARDRIHDAFDAFVGQLHQHGMITDEEAQAAALTVEVFVEDARTTDDDPLPELPPRRR